MKIKEISAGVKLTKNYDSYQASLTAEVEVGEIPEKVGEVLMEKALVIVNEKMNVELDKKSFGKIKKIRNETEVGAAWISKESKDKLSVQYSKNSKFEDVDVKDLEKTEQGYRQENSEGIFNFKKLSERQRSNNKMPMYRIYKVGGKNEK